MDLTWQTFLQDEFLKRKAGNARYSMRAFAKSLGMSPSYARMVLKGQRSIALASVRPLSRKLNWPEPKENLFRLLVEKDGAKDANTKSDLDARITAHLARDKDFSRLELKDFQVMSAWYHAALIELTRTKSYDPKPAAMARRLGISTMEVELALDRLMRLGILVLKDGIYQRSRGPLTVGDVPSSAIRKFHKEMLKRAEVAMETRPISERLMSGVTLAVPADKIDMVNERITALRRDLATMFGDQECDAVYHVAIQYFRLDTGKVPSPTPNVKERGRGV